MTDEMWERIDKRDRRRAVGAKIAKIIAAVVGIAVAVCVACLIYLSCRGVTLFARLEAPPAMSAEKTARAFDCYKRNFRDHHAGSFLLEMTCVDSYPDADGAEVYVFHEKEYQLLPSPVVGAGVLDRDFWHVDIKVTDNDCEIIAEGYA